MHVIYHCMHWFYTWSTLHEMKYQTAIYDGVYAVGVGGQGGFYPTWAAT